MKTGIFQSWGHCWVFQSCWHIQCSTFTASSFRIWNSSTGIPSPPLALFVAMFSKAHLTSYSRMSGSRLVITPLWLSGSWRSFLYSSSVYSCHLFLISSASVRSRPCTGHSKHPLPTTQEKTVHMDITRWSTPKSDWSYSLQPKMEKLYTVNKNKTRSWLWLRSWAPYYQIQTQIEESRENR